MKTIKEVRESFWRDNPQFSKDYRVKKRQNEYKCNIRVSFCDYVDYLNKEGIITEKLAESVTL